jgi:hypothetical protein
MELFKITLTLSIDNAAMVSQVMRSIAPQMKSAASADAVNISNVIDVAILEGLQQQGKADA